MRFRLEYTIPAEDLAEFRSQTEEAAEASGLRRGTSAGAGTARSEQR